MNWFLVNYYYTYRLAHLATFIRETSIFQWAVSSEDSQLDRARWVRNRRMLSRELDIWITSSLVNGQGSFQKSRWREQRSQRQWMTIGKLSSGHSMVSRSMCSQQFWEHARTRPRQVQARPKPSIGRGAQQEVPPQLSSYWILTAVGRERVLSKSTPWKSTMLQWRTTGLCGKQNWSWWVNKQKQKQQNPKMRSCVGRKGGMDLGRVRSVQMGSKEVIRNSQRTIRDSQKNQLHA